MNQVLLALCFIIMSLPQTCLAAQPLQLVKSGKTKYVIVLAPSASAPEKHAAYELAAYLKNITGATFNIVNPDLTDSKPRIAVGPEAAKSVFRELPLDKAKMGDDGIVMRTFGADLVLTGAAGSKRGTLYAVFTFLEDICGVRWWTTNSEYVPNKSDLRIGSLNIAYTPVFRYREALYNYLIDAKDNPELTRFLVQQKYNGDHNRIPAEWGGGYKIIGWCHTSEVFMPPEKYFEAHPDWYSQINGKSVKDRSQLCYTNADMIAELTKNVLDAIAKEPDAGIISVSQNDWENNCQCPKCKAMDDAEGSPSGSLIYCVNKVAEAVDSKYPGFLVETLAYMHTRKPPKSIRPRNNVLVRLALIERTSTQPIDSLFNKKLMDDLTSWKQAVPNLFIWDYTANLPFPFTPHPNLSVLAPDSRTYAANHVVGVFNEGNHYAGDARGDFDELKTYVMSHILWNPQQDEKKLVGEFLNGYYGKAGSYLKKYLDIQTEKSKNLCLGSWDCGPDAAWLDLDAMNRATQLFDKAEAAVAGDPLVLDRVKRARIPLEHQWVRGFSLYRQAARAENRPNLGPKDISTATENLIKSLEKHEGNNVRIDLFSSDASGDLASYAAKLRKRASAIVNPAPFPAEFSGLAAGSVVDVQESDMAIKRGASMEADSQASNGFAAKIDPAVLNWSVQFGGIGGTVLPGKLHVYASVRCEKIKDSGVAFTAGIYDDFRSVNLVGLSVNIEGSGSICDVDPNVKTANAIGSTVSAGDGKYHLYDFGVHDLNNRCYVWFGTTGGVSPEIVKSIYVDRIIFVRE